MTEPFLGQIMTAGFPFAPRGYALCDGQTVPIQQNQALFALIGVYYGGNGSTNFMLPDLRGRTPFGAGTSADSGWNPTPAMIGTQIGVEAVTLLTPEMGGHTHPLLATAAAGEDGTPSDGETFALSTPAAYGAPSALVPLSAGPTSITGGNRPHNNMQPLLVLSMCIALQGIFPSRS